MTLRTARRSGLVIVIALFILYMVFALTRHDPLRFSINGYERFMPGNARPINEECYDLLHYTYQWEFYCVQRDTNDGRMDIYETGSQGVVTSTAFIFKSEIRFGDLVALYGWPASMEFDIPGWHYIWWDAEAYSGPGFILDRKMFWFETHRGDIDDDRR